MNRHRQSTDAPLPYNGQELDRKANLGRPFSKVGFGHDQHGTREYRFNSLGFRSPEFDGQAKHRIYAFGESHAFGYFVDAEQCWPARFARLWAASQGASDADLCFQNFADVGASNAGIVRSLISQCSAAPPDIVLVHFSEHRRGEVYLQGQPHRIGPWLVAPETAQAAPAEEPLRSAYLEQIERAGHFYAYALGVDAVGPQGIKPGLFDLDVDATCIEDTLRNILLVQYFCRAQGIQAIATCDLVESLFNDPVRNNPSLAPLLAQVDPELLSPLRIWSVDGDRADDAGHAGPIRHDRFARVLLQGFLASNKDISDQVPGPQTDAPSQRDPAAASREPWDAVRRFYNALPFNHWRTVEAAADSLRHGDALDAYPDLQRLLVSQRPQPILEAGCGAGWLTVSLALHHGVSVTAVDFSRRALERARQVADTLEVGRQIHFIENDLLCFEPSEPVDLLISLGVLHHTADPQAAVRRVSGWVRPGGHLYLGLYHAPGRQVFLDHFSASLAQGETTALDAFRRLATDWADDDEHLRSWFRDQVLHPQESQHTLRQVHAWLKDIGYRLESTSINRFQPFDDVEELYAMESSYAERSRQALAEGRFFPGFFTLLARRL